MHARAVLGVGKGVLFGEVSSFQRLKCMREWYLGWEKVSCLERCPQFRSDLTEEFCHIPLPEKDDTLTFPQFLNPLTINS